MAMHECAQNHPQWSCLVKGRMRDLNSKAEEEEELMPKGSTVRLLEERQEQQKNAAQTETL